MAALLRKHMPQLNVKNFAYEGGSLPNSAIMYRYLQKQHYPIKAIIFNINQKQFNSADSAYNTLHPALGLASQSFLTTADRARLSAKTLQDKRTLIERQIEDNWRLYRLRTDLREAIFKTDDAATLLTKTIHDVTGETRRAAVADKPDPDRYIGSYDLSPLTNTNIGIIYLREMLNAFCAQRIPVLGFLTPTNHQLLHDSIDTPEYEANLQYVIALPHCSTVTLVNLDHAIPGDEFIDNDHLTPQGQQHLATLLMPQIRKLAQ